MYFKSTLIKTIRTDINVNHTQKCIQYQLVCGILVYTNIFHFVTFLITYFTFKHFW